MKTKSLATIFLVGLLAAATPLSVLAANPAGEAIKGTPVIDGTMEEIWNSATTYNVDKPKAESPTDRGVIGTFKVLWDEKNLYAFVDVVDNTKSITDDTAALQLTDGIELYFSLNKSDAAEYGEQDFASNLNRSGYFKVKDSTDIKNVVTEKADGSGYTIEVEIPLSTLVDGYSLNENGIIGFDVQINDNFEEDTTRDAFYGWSDSEDKAWQDPSSFGEIKFIPAPAAPAETTATPVTEAVIAPVTESTAPQVAPQTNDNFMLYLALGGATLLATTITLKKALKK